jgi:hypothetical protein
MISRHYIQRDGTRRMFTSPKQGDTTLYITSRGDNIETGERGTGDTFLIQDLSDGEKTISIQFIDDIYVKDGVVLWQNAKPGDRASLEIVLPENTMFPSPNGTGNYDINTYGEVVENTEGTGEYMMYPVPVTLNRFVNEIMMLGDNTVGYVIESADTAFVPKQLVMRLRVNSDTNNPDLIMSVSAELYRKHTV